PAAEDDLARQGGGGVRPLHHDGPGGGAARTVHVLRVRRRLRGGSRGHRGSTAGVGGGLHGDARGARTAQVARGLAGRGADRQPRAGALLYFHTVDCDRTAHFAADVDDADTGGVLGRLGQLDFLAPRQHHVELGLQHATVVDVGDVDGPTVAGDVVHHGFGRTRHRGAGRAAGGRRARQCRQREDGDGRAWRRRWRGWGGGRLGQRRQRRDDGVLLRTVDDHQRDDEADDGEHSDCGDNPEPARRLRAVWRRRLRGLTRRILRAVLAGRKRVIAIRRVGG